MCVNPFLSLKSFLLCLEFYSVITMLPTISHVKIILIILEDLSSAVILQYRLVSIGSTMNLIRRLLDFFLGMYIDVWL